MVAGGLAMAKVFGWPIVQWVAHVPLLRTVHYSSYYGILGAYAICVLAAFGVEAIRTGRRGTSRSRSAVRRSPRR